ncbi:hypothetical protein GCM10022276_28330 [Sphingomonas limnosediminicola]|uniref:Uncharacterized protein n=1 Tax=Sphingomonas limnosediminicola TaxID=940133 RepID=A0ABP7LTY9_9SPHN
MGNTLSLSFRKNSKIVNPNPIRASDVRTTAMSVRSLAIAVRSNDIAVRCDDRSLLIVSPIKCGAGLIF